MKSDRETGYCCQRRMSEYYSKKVAVPTPKGTDGAVRAERNLFQLCRVVTDEPEGNHLFWKNIRKPLTGAAQLPL